VSRAEGSHNWQKLVHPVQTVDRKSEHLQLGAYVDEEDKSRAC